MEYKSTYFDTADNFMYLKHHNRKLNKFKVRRKTYTNLRNAVQQNFEVAMVNADHTIKKQTEQSESMRHLIVKSVLRDY